MKAVLAMPSCLGWKKLADARFSFLTTWKGWFFVVFGFSMRMWDCQLCWLALSRQCRRFLVRLVFVRSTFQLRMFGIFVGIRRVVAWVCGVSLFLGVDDCFWLGVGLVWEVFWRGSEKKAFLVYPSRARRVWVEQGLLWRPLKEIGRLVDAQCHGDPCLDGCPVIVYGVCDW